MIKSRNIMTTPKKERIKSDFGGKLVGNSKMQKLVCESLLLFPQKISNFVTKNVWFISSFDDSWGFVLRGDELRKGKYLIFLGDELFDQDKYSQEYTIAHEIGHVILGHKNSFIENQSGKEIDEQEREAHKFAIQYVDADR